jgi:uncharacterized protein YsxB (DUF464 family)
MIIVRIYRTEHNQIYGFEIKNHGKSIVCAAVSILALNTINSIENFTDEHIIYDYKENGGLLHCELPGTKNGEYCRDTELLMDSLVLGLTGIETEYKKQIKIFDKEV